MKTINAILLLFVASLFSTALADFSGNAKVDYIQTDNSAIDNIYNTCDNIPKSNFVFMRLVDAANPSSDLLVYFSKDDRVTLSIALSALTNGTTVYWEAQQLSTCTMSQVWHKLYRLRINKF
jgi:hypothetical protein